MPARSDSRRQAQNAHVSWFTATDPHLLHDRIGDAVRVCGLRAELPRDRAEHGAGHGERGHDGQHDEAELPRPRERDGVPDDEGRDVVRKVACALVQAGELHVLLNNDKIKIWFNSAPTFSPIAACTAAVSSFMPCHSATSISSSVSSAIMAVGIIATCKVRSIENCQVANLQGEECLVESSPHLEQYPGRCSGVEEAYLLAQDTAEVPLPEPIGLPDACTRGRSGR